MKYFLLISVLALSLSTIQSKGSTSVRKETFRLNAGSQEEKVKIKKEELPEAAIKTLDGDAFKGWSVANVYKLKSGDFEVELKKGEKGETTQSIKFDKDGKVK